MSRSSLLPLLVLASWGLACLGCTAPTGPSETPTPTPAPDVFPDPAAWGTLSGPGGPAVRFSDDQLLEHCSYLTGGPEDIEHHNLVVMIDGYLLLPWSPEDGGGGLTFFDFSDPCAPTKVGEVWHPRMRETHSLAFSPHPDDPASWDGRRYLAVDSHWETEEGEVVGGIGVWDISDPAAPVWVSELALPGYNYPDAYVRVTLSNFWVGDVLYSSGGINGAYIIDMSDPLNPSLISQWQVEPSLLFGSFHVVGDVAMASNAGLLRTLMVDVSDRLTPSVIPGGDFTTTDRFGTEWAYYFANIGGPYALFARKAQGGGPVIYDISDPGNPTFVGDYHTEDGSGGYVFRFEDMLFHGDSDFAHSYDISDPTDPIQLDRFDLRGDLDTITPVGSVAVLSVDSGATAGQSTAVVPWRAEPDRRGPEVGWARPADGQGFVPLSSGIGLSFDEPVEVVSVFAGSVRVMDRWGRRVPGRFNVQENLVNFTPDAPLEADQSYTVVVPAGGVCDWSGNPTEDEYRFTFSTGAP